MAVHVVFTPPVSRLFHDCSRSKNLGHRPAPRWSKSLAAEVEPRISANLPISWSGLLFFTRPAYCLFKFRLKSSAAVPLPGFIAGRLAHSYVQICTTNIRVRGLVFTVNFLLHSACGLLFCRREPRPNNCSPSSLRKVSTNRFARAAGLTQALGAMLESRPSSCEEFARSATRHTQMFVIDDMPAMRELPVAPRDVIARTSHQWVLRQSWNT